MVYRKKITLPSKEVQLINDYLEGKDVKELDRARPFLNTALYDGTDAVMDIEAEPGPEACMKATLHAHGAVVTSSCRRGYLGTWTLQDDEGNTYVTIVAEETEELRKFQDLCYEAYKLEWMLSHGYNLEDYVEGLASVADDYLYSDDECLEGSNFDQFTTLAFEFECEKGFMSGSMWVCRDEFLGAEFLDPDYMDHLFTLIDPLGEKRRFYRENVIGG